MNGEEIILISNCIRTFLIVFTNITLYFFLLTNILKRKCGFPFFIIWGLVKVIGRDLILTLILPFYYPGADWLQVTNVISVLAFAVLATVCHYLVIEGEFIRFAIVNVFSEMLATFCGFFCLAIVNMAEGRTSVWEVGVFQWPDLIYPVFATAVVGLVWHFGKPLLLKLRTCRLPFPALLWTVYLAYMFIAALSSFTSIHDFGAASLICAMIFMVIFLFLVVTAIYYRQRVQRDKEFLDAQIRLFETHYNMIQVQIQNMDQSKDMLEEQMKWITEREDEADSETMERYMNQLKQNYGELKAGIYCNDWTVDAALYSQKLLYDQKGIEFSCLMQEYDRGRIGERDIIELILILFQHGLQAKAVEFKAAAIKNQLMIQMKMEKGNNIRYLKSRCRNIVDRYNGSIEIQKDGDKQEVNLVLQKNILE